ncbi:MAG: hypothetical protein KatS3mg061_3249 [Dehalococcoidia bacterium]|nr:MAG: hypothetical protein KatS3mg061_3249 [Dehalococcoidia bacterium]
MTTPRFHPDRALRLAPATASDFPALATLFGALHAHNATLDPLFALADGWCDLLRPPL